MLKNNRFKIIIVIGLIAIIGVITTQLLMLRRAYQLERKEYQEKIYIALTEVVQNIHKNYQSEMPHTNPIKKVSDEYYIVNVAQVFDVPMLEYYLRKEFQRVKLNTDFEFAIYNCSTDKMVYGKYINSSDDVPAKCEDCFPKNKDLVYYFAIRFPELKQNYWNSLQMWTLYTAVLFLVLGTYVYSVVLLLKQKKFSELQKDFINNMTHEFKTPLSSILIASNYIKQHEHIKQEPKLNQYISIVIDQSEKLNQHIEKILYVAKTDSKQIIIKKKKTEIISILQSVQTNIQLKYPQAEIHINIPQPLFLEADSFHLYNVAYNLIENSIKYCDTQPIITITNTPLKKYTRIDFIDNGRGIHTEKITQVFDKFFRAHTEKENNSKGFGLGLFYVKKIIQLHHWKITLKNNPHAGITVSITAPNIT